MFEFWAVLGRLCIDSDFHIALHGHASPAAVNLLEIPGFHAFALAQRYRLSRWEVMETNRIVCTRNGMNGTIEVIADPTKDAEVSAIRSGWPSGAPGKFQHAQADEKGVNRLELCAVLGLCSIDSQYHNEVSRTGSASVLGLQFTLTSEEQSWLRTWIHDSDAQSRTMSQRLASFEQLRWEQPHELTLSCSPGSTLKEFVYLDEAKLAAQARIDKVFSETLQSALRVAPVSPA